MTNELFDRSFGQLHPNSSNIHPSLPYSNQLAREHGIMNEEEYYVWMVGTIIQGRYYLTAAVLVLFLDILLTLDVEVERVWGAKLTSASILFFINRYLPPTMYGIVLFSLNYAHLSEKFCVDTFQLLPPLLIVVSEAIIGALLILRTCALYKRARSHLSGAVLGILLVTYFAQVGISVYVAKDLKARGPIRRSFNEGCILFFAQNDIRLLYLWFTNIVFNVIVFLCTFKKTARLHWMGREADKVHAIHSLILVDATQYFIAVMIAKTMNLVMLVFYPQWNSINWAANHVIDVVLTSHFFLHLREEASRPMKIRRTFSIEMLISEAREQLFISITRVNDMYANHPEDIRSERQSNETTNDCLHVQTVAEARGEERDFFGRGTHT